jgi:hypothetical protein
MNRDREELLHVATALAAETFRESIIGFNNENAAFHVDAAASLIAEVDRRCREEVNKQGRAFELGAGVALASVDRNRIIRESELYRLVWGVRKYLASDGYGDIIRALVELEEK